MLLFQGEVEELISKRGSFTHLRLGVGGYFREKGN